MRTAYKVPELAQGYENFEQHVVGLVKKHGQAKASQELGLSQSTVSRLLKGWGWSQQVTWVKEG